MAYTPTTWTTGDDVTATKLNKLEQGVANAGSALILDRTGTGLSATYKEIWDALESGIPVYYRFIYGDYTNYYQSTCYLCPIVTAYKYDNAYRVIANRPTAATVSGKAYIYAPAVMVFEASGINDYPVFYTTILPASNSSKQEQVW